MSAFVVPKTDIAGLRRMGRPPKATPTIARPSESNGSKDNQVCRTVQFVPSRCPFFCSSNDIQSNVSPTTDDPLNDAILEWVTNSSGAENSRKRYVYIPAISNHGPNSL
jgi:hypothetical protein